MVALCNIYGVYLCTKHLTNVPSIAHISHMSSHVSLLCGSAPRCDFATLIGNVEVVMGRLDHQQFIHSIVVKHFI